LISGRTYASTPHVNRPPLEDVFGLTDWECFLGTVTCENVNTVAPAKDDCRALIKYISSYAPASLTLGAGKIYDWTYGTCTIAVANGDTISYTMCYETIAYDAGIAGDACFGKMTAGACAGTSLPGDNYAIA